MDNNLTYNRALSQLEAILTQMRSDNCDVETLAERTRQAAELLEYCRKRLTTTENELEAILRKLEQDTAAQP